MDYWQLFNVHWKRVPLPNIQTHPCQIPRHTCTLRKVNRYSSLLNGSSVSFLCSGGINSNRPIGRGEGEWRGTQKDRGTLQPTSGCEQEECNTRDGDPVMWWLYNYLSSYFPTHRSTTHTNSHCNCIHSWSCSPIPCMRNEKFHSIWKGLLLLEVSKMFPFLSYKQLVTIYREALLFLVIHSLCPISPRDKMKMEGNPSS